jgi:DNA-binding transcriptional LysR family regulator
MERAGFTPMIAAEIHNMHMQLAFVQAGYGVGLLPARFIARNHSFNPVEVCLNMRHLQSSVYRHWVRGRIDRVLDRSGVPVCRPVGGSAGTLY